MSTSTSTPTGRPSDPDLTRRILEATVALIMRNGYDRLRIEQVAKEAGVGKPAIYRRHADKAELVADAVMSVMRLGQTPDTGDVVTDLLQHALVNQENQQQPTANVPTRQGLLAVVEPEVFPLLWDRFFSFRRDQGAEILSRAVTRGQIPQDVDVDVLLDTIAGLTLYRGTVKQIDITRAQYEAVIAALVAHPPRLAD